MRILISVLAVLAVAACSQEAPDKPQGVGFGNYDRYTAERRAREEALSRRQTEQTRQAQATQPEGPVGSEAEQTASAALEAIGASPQPQPARNLPRPDLDNPDISDEQDFDAVSGRQSIESDAERRAAQSAQYKIIQPKALPSRPRGKAVTPIEFALSTNHPVGKKVYSRGITRRAKTERNCAKFQSPDAAQDEFLKAGGPKRDRLGIDPDGDGYACNWNPAVFRTAVRN